MTVRHLEMESSDIGNPNPQLKSGIGFSPCSPIETRAASSDVLMLSGLLHEAGMTGRLVASPFCRSSGSQPGLGILRSLEDLARKGILAFGLLSCSCVSTIVHQVMESGAGCSMGSYANPSQEICSQPHAQWS